MGILRGEILCGRAWLLCHFVLLRRITYLEWRNTYAERHWGKLVVADNEKHHTLASGIPEHAPATLLSHPNLLDTPSTKS